MSCDSHLCRLLRKTRRATTFASIAKGNAKLHTIFSQLGNTQLEWLKLALIAVYVVATMGVVAGVVLERDTFPERLKDAGWTILVAALAIETLAGGFIFMVDAEIQGRLGSGITALAGVADKARQTAKDALTNAKDANLRLSGLAGRVTNLSGRENTLHAALQTTEAHARNALAQISPLAEREVSLSGGLSAEEKLLNSHETRLSGDEAKQEENEKRLGDLQTETREYETENIDRGLALDDQRAMATLRPYADVPIFISSHDDPETLQLSNRIEGMIRVGTGKEPRTLRDSPHNFAGVHVFFERPFKSGSTDAEDAAIGHETDRQRAAAMAICRELQSSKVDDVIAEIELVDEAKKPLSFIYWDRAVPKTAVLIRVGPPTRPLIEKMRMKLNGMERLLELEHETDESEEKLAKDLGRKGPCEPETL